MSIKISKKNKNSFEVFQKRKNVRRYELIAKIINDGNNNPLLWSKASIVLNQDEVSEIELEMQTFEGNQ